LRLSPWPDSGTASPSSNMAKVKMVTNGKPVSGPFLSETKRKPKLTTRQRLTAMRLKMEIRDRKAGRKPAGLAISQKRLAGLRKKKPSAAKRSR